MSTPVLSHYCKNLNIGDILLPEDGGGKSPRNVGKFLPQHEAVFHNLVIFHHLSDFYF
jgi:hypothetical protein